MSGNPFRVSQKHNTVPAANAVDAADSSQLESNTVQASSLPPKTKKNVRIASPTSSPLPDSAIPDDALLHRISPVIHAGSPPSPSAATFSDDVEDSFGEPFSTRGDVENDRYDQKPVKHARPKPDMAEGAPARTSSRVPANPFSKTLATIEPQANVTAEHREALSDRPTAERTGSGNTRASMDVEAFKRMLMTGNANPPGSGVPSAASKPAPAHGAFNESSSSTDTSSISRQSIFDSLQEPHQETPRTSYEMPVSEDDDDRSMLMGEGMKSEKKKPPPPTHRHGKLVTPRHPQTVSFSDFSTSVMSPSQPTSSPQAPMSRKRTDSDLNKPLPPPPTSPPVHISDQNKFHDEPQEQPTITEVLSSPIELSTAQKKVPPPPPITRRHSQLRSSNPKSRSRSNSALTMSSQISEDSIAPSITAESTFSTQSHKSPPPPPPSRRHGNNIPGSANTSTTEPSSIPTTSSRAQPLTSPTPPAPRKTSTISSPPPSPSVGLARTASVSSNRSSRNNVRSPSNESSTMAPPPPPPRRRQSGRSSFDKERPVPGSPTESKRNSIDSLRRRTSVASQSSLRRESTPLAEEEGQEGVGEKVEPAESGKDILDDMEKFQREIDELRGVYRKVS